MNQAEPDLVAALNNFSQQLLSSDFQGTSKQTDTEYFEKCILEGYKYAEKWNSEASKCESLENKVTLSSRLRENLEKIEKIHNDLQELKTSVHSILSEIEDN